MHRFSSLWLYRVIIPCHGSTCNFASTPIFTQDEDTVLSRPIYPKIKPLGPRQCRLLQYGKTYHFLPSLVDNMVALFHQIDNVSAQPYNASKAPILSSTQYTKNIPSFSFASPRHANHATLKIYCIYTISNARMTCTLS